MEAATEHRPPGPSSEQGHSKGGEVRAPEVVVPQAVVPQAEPSTLPAASATEQQQAEVTEESSASKSSMLKERMFLRLREKWKLLGLFEIEEDHALYDLTCILKDGFAAALQDSIDHPREDVLSSTDYKAVLTQSHEGFVMRTYAGPVFAHLRHTMGMSEKKYQISLASDGCYLQFISNSKSKADFFLTNDKQFYLKTQTKREIRFLLATLSKYVQHLESYPHSLLVKYLGLHSVRLHHERKIYLLIMQSVFYPDERISARYDIKGCKVNRWTEPAPEGTKRIPVMKDLNFEGKSITLAQQRSWFINQIEMDTKFLEGLNVLDYSILVGFQLLHADEKSQSFSLASLIARTKKSMHTAKSPTTSTRTVVPGAVEEEHHVIDPAAQSGTHTHHAQEGDIGVRIKMPRMGHQVSAESDPSHPFTQNRRLLPNYKNALHVIDGPELRYFVGIIDTFTVYTLRKRLEHLWKSIRFRGLSYSTVCPSRYGSRLRQWVETHTV